MIRVFRFESSQQKGKQLAGINKKGREKRGECTESKTDDKSQETTSDDLVGDKKRKEREKRI